MLECHIKAVIPAKLVLDLIGEPVSRNTKNIH
jgi:hypothetical protein